MAQITYVFAKCGDGRWTNTYAAFMISVYFVVNLNLPRVVCARSGRSTAIYIYMLPAPVSYDVVHTSPSLLSLLILVSDPQ